MCPIKIPQQEKVLALKSEYKYCNYVLSSANTLAHFKKLLSVDMKDKLWLFFCSKPDIKGIFPYNTILRSTIDGEYVTPLLIFSGNRRLSFRPIFT